MWTSKTISFTLFITTTLLGSCNASAKAKTQPLFPAILIFGDSTVDTGNNNYPSQTIFRAKHVPYGIDLPNHSPNGRFSNGKIFSDIIATKLNIKQFVPPFLQPNLTDQEIVTEVCFASAGAGYDDQTSLTTQAIRVSEQPNMFKSYIARLKSIVGDKKAMKIINNALVVVSAGPNDFILNYYEVPSWRRMYPSISDYQDFVLSRLNNFVKVSLKIFPHYKKLGFGTDVSFFLFFYVLVLLISRIIFPVFFAGALQPRLPENFGRRFTANGMFTDSNDCSIPQRPKVLLGTREQRLCFIQSETSEALTSDTSISYRKQDPLL